MGNRIVLLCPYFGTINKSIHSIWIQSCASNPEISFLLITDDTEALNMDMPTNVKGVFVSWEDFVEQIKRKIGFDIALKDPYKLCDFKPAYGYLLSEYLQDYDYWGHLDSSDTVLGDLRRFITDEMLESYEKIHSFGHLTIYRNTPEVNKRFLIAPSCGLACQQLFSRPEVTGFDEMNHPWSINTIYKENGFPLLEHIPDLVADLFPTKWPFQIVEDMGQIIPRVFEWEQGKLYDVTVRNKTLQRREIGYVHFQKRKMINAMTNGVNHFYMIPNRFIPASTPLTCELIEKCSKNRLYLDPFKGRVKRIINYSKQPKVFIRKIHEKIN